MRRRVETTTNTPHEAGASPKSKGSHYSQDQKEEQRSETYSKHNRTLKGAERRAGTKKERGAARIAQHPTYQNQAPESSEAYP